LRHYVILIDGEMEGFHAADPDHEPVMIWQSRGTVQMPPPQRTFDPRNPIVGEEFVEIGEQLPDGSLRRSYWRLR